MRTKLGYILPFLLIATPVLAQNWSYKPAPGDWYVPSPNAHRDNTETTNTVSVPTEVAPKTIAKPEKKKSNPIFGRKKMTETTNDISDWQSLGTQKSSEFSQDEVKLDSKTEIRKASEMAQNSPGLQTALNCAASLQIAALAAPEWSSEPGVAQATNLWLERVFTEADTAGVAGDKVKELVKEEMDKQTTDAVNNPQNLNKRAFDCATNMPS
jgi:hypothetical protein